MDELTKSLETTEVHASFIEISEEHVLSYSDINLPTI